MSPRRSIRILFPLLAALGLAVSGALVGLAPSAAAAEAPVGLGTASSFAVLAGSTVTNTGPTVVRGDLGVHAGSAVTGFPPGIVTEGTIHAADAVAQQAQSDTTTAYNDAAGRSSTSAAGAELAGQTLVGGVYTGGTLGLNGTLTLDGQGDPATVFIFQASTTLITGSASRVELIGGAQACNVFWQVGSSATLATDTVFVGTVLALTSIEAQTRASVAGRLLARNGAVTLDTNVITASACATASDGTATTALPTSSSTETATGGPNDGSTPSPGTAAPGPGVTVPGGTARTTSRASGGPDLPRTGVTHTGGLAIAGFLLLTFGTGVGWLSRPAPPGAHFVSRWAK
jgi:hypothetical protein